MKHNKVLHRPMFNAQNSAYGRGITSNLVSEEQRVKYNTGGRVNTPQRGLVNQPGGYAGIIQKGPTGEPRQEHAWWSVLPWAGKGIQKAWKPITAMGPKISKWAKSPATGWGSGELGLAKKGAELATPVAKGAGSWFKKAPVSSTYGLGVATSGIGEERDFSLDPRGWLGYGKSKKEVPGEVIDKFTAEDVEKIGKTEVEQEVDTKSDTLDWTDQEKKEKKGQIQLKLAQRLVGGARDPWGSAKQMKNVGDWLGDVAAIGDKTELRKEERKYQAWAKAKKDIARDVQASTLEYNNLRAAGVGEAKALDISTGGKIKATTIPSKTNQKLRNKSLAATSKGDIIYDEDIQAFTLSGLVDENGRAIAVPKEKLVAVQEEFIKRGA